MSNTDTDLSESTDSSPLEAAVQGRIRSGGIIAILRGDFRGVESDIAHALSRAGVQAIEVTLNSPHPFVQISALVRAMSGTMAVGAGTVCTIAEAELAAEAGAQFIVSANMNVGVICHTKKLGLVSIPGCFTPSEIMEAQDAGADMVKLFPAIALGSSFLRALRGPLPNMQAVPTGGLTPDLVGDFISAGAVAVGLGSDLVPTGVHSHEKVVDIHNRATRFIAIVRAARSCFAAANVADFGGGERPGDKKPLF
jgi:2-dehydro-3-deoxyphosphogluconate aldolase / (4S)-4-hydroxy-2-oxoglutarate aldolase